MHHTLRRGAPAVLSLLAVATIVLTASQTAWAVDGSGVSTPAPVTATATAAPDPSVTPASDPASPSAPDPTTTPVPAVDPTVSVPVPAAPQKNLQLPPGGLTNTPPVAHDDSLSTEENTALLFPAASLLANDTDADGDTLSVVDPTGPTAHGYLSGAGGGQYLYYPDSGFTGTDSFTYFANDGQADSLTPATVTITVKFTPGINHAPVAVNDLYSTPQDTPLVVGAPGIYANDYDPDGDPLVGTDVISLPKHGILTTSSDGSFTYAPFAGFAGPDSFIYLVSDGKAESAAAQVVINVGGPVVVPDPIHAVDDAFTMPMNTGFSLSAPGVTSNDTDNVPMNVQGITIGTSTVHGALTHGTHGEFTYVPNPGFVGTDTFTYSAYNGVNWSNYATVTITVTDPVVTPDPIHAVDDAFNVAMNSSLVVSAPGVTSNDTDNVPMNVQGITIGTSTSHGALTHGTHGGFTYTPNPGFVGADTFTYSAYNGVNWSNSATVTITVTDPGVPPITTPTPTPTPTAGGGDACHDFTGTPLASCDPPAAGDPCKDVTGAPLASCDPHVTTTSQLAHTGSDPAPALEFAGSLLLLGIAGLAARAIARRPRRRDS